MVTTRLLLTKYRKKAPEILLNGHFLTIVTFDISSFIQHTQIFISRGCADIADSEQGANVTCNPNSNYVDIGSGDIFSEQRACSINDGENEGDEISLTALERDGSVGINTFEGLMRKGFEGFLQLVYIGAIRSNESHIVCTDNISNHLNVC